MPARLLAFVHRWTQMPRPTPHPPTQMSADGSLVPWFFGSLVPSFPGSIPPRFHPDDGGPPCLDGGPHRRTPETVDLVEEMRTHPESLKTFISSATDEKRTAPPPILKTMTPCGYYRSLPLVNLRPSARRKPLSDSAARISRSCRPSGLQPSPSGSTTTLALSPGALTPIPVSPAPPWLAPWGYASHPPPSINSGQAPGNVLPGTPGELRLPGGSHLGAIHKADPHARWRAP
jgi:hypothetical protein